jgi:2-polyprenyl-3-methyl-5-hydroxy-6-metoxy-1,4-benzoquinol methylase
MITKQKLEQLARGFDTSKDFDAVMAYYDVLEVADKLRGRNILEMGTSAGTITRYLLPHVDTLDIVEGSETGIERTRELLGDGEGKITYHHELWGQFNPAKKYSDIVFVRGLEHVEEPSELLSTMKDWLTDDGKIHIIVPNAHSLHRKVMVRQGELSDLYALRDRDHQVGHVQVYDKETLESDVRKSGLRIAHSSGFFVKPVSTSQMGDISMDPKHPFVKACYVAGKVMASLGTQLYVVGEKNG